MNIIKTKYNVGDVVEYVIDGREDYRIMDKETRFARVLAIHIDQQGISYHLQDAGKNGFLTTWREEQILKVYKPYEPVGQENK